MALYATASELASYLQVPSVDTATATLVLTVASGQFSLYADTQFAPTTVTYTTLGTPFINLALPFRPVTAVSAVRINGATVTGYSLIKNTLYRAAGFGTPLNTPPDVVAVDLTHGFAAVPDDVKAAVLDMAAQAYSVPVGAVIAETIDDYAVRYANASGGVQLTPFARDLAALYRGTLVA